MANVRGYETDERPAHVRPAATLVGMYRGRKVYRVPVDVRLSDSRSDLLETCGTIGTVHTSILAHSAQDAANAIADEWRNRPETEVVAYGPKGGKTARYIGWYTAIGSAMFAERPAQVQIRFAF